MEPTEVREFTEQMKDASEAGEMTRVALAISVLAVLVALVTVMGHGPQSDALLMQSRANDQWSEYQAKKIRQDNLMVVVDELNVAALAFGGDAGEDRRIQGPTFRSGAGIWMRARRRRGSLRRR